MSSIAQTNVYYGTGRRKNSIARVRLLDGVNESTVNGRSLEEYFPHEVLRMVINQPFEAVKLEGRFGLKVNVRGGGLSGQAGAVRLGVARALIVCDDNLKPVLRKNGFLTRDSRKKERKKYGRKGARKSFQYTKR
jgi:small subunit ribosomal protein S9